MRAICSDRPNGTHNVFQKVKRIRRFSEHKQFVGHPGHRSSRPGTRDGNVYVPWVPHTAHKPLTPGHRSGDPWPPGRETPPHPGSHRKNLFMFMCLFLSRLLRGSLRDVLRGSAGFCPGSTGFSKDVPVVTVCL